MQVWCSSGASMPCSRTCSPATTMVSPSMIFAGPVTSANDGRAATAPKSKKTAMAAWRSIKRSYYAVAQVEGANSRYRTGGDDRRGQPRTPGPQAGIDPRPRPSGGGVVETRHRALAPQRAGRLVPRDRRHPFPDDTARTQQEQPESIGVAAPVVAVSAGSNDTLLLDDFARDDLISAFGTPWRGFSDRVMGGVSQEVILLAM